MAKGNQATKKISLYMVNLDVVKSEIMEVDKTKNIDKLTTQDVVGFLCNYLIVRNYSDEEINNVANYKLKLMFKKTTTNRKSNNAYFEPILINKNLFDDNANDNKAILFLYNDDRIYVMPIGTSYGDFAPYIDEYFGIKVLGKCISEEKFDVFNQKTQSVAGYEKLSNSSYRNGCSLSMVKKIENVLKEIGGKLDTSMLTDELKNIFTKTKVSVNAKASISFGNKISFSDTIKIVDWIETILNSNRENLILNGMQIIKKKSKLYEHYLIRVIENLYTLFERFLTGDSNINKYDIIHKEPDQYLKADKIEIVLGNDVSVVDDTNSLSSIFDKIYPNVKKEDFVKIIKNGRIISYDENDSALTEDTIINHLSGEIPFVDGDECKLIIMDGEIIQLNNQYLSNINNKLRTEIEQRKYTGSNLPQWNNSRDETDYISQFIEKGGLIIHPKKPKGIELCDVIIKTEFGYSMLFIKQGFDYNVRDLSSQMKISKQLSSDNIFDEYWSSLVEILSNEEKSGKNNNLFLFDIQDLKESIKNKKCEYVFVVYVAGERLLENQEKFNSCIAKISLDDLIGEFNRTSHRLKICKIED